MAEKHLVVQGATCMCNFGTTPDKLLVLTNKKEYANDSNGSKKLIATTLDIGSTFEKNTFGACAKLNGNKCTAMIMEWKKFYKDVLLRNGGNILLEDSLGTCPIGGPDCIKIMDHGQIAEASAQNVKNVDEDVQSVLNPGVSIQKITLPVEETDGLILI